MTAPPQTNAQGLDTSKFAVTEDSFFKCIEQEMSKVEDFTLSQVTAIRKKIHAVEEQLKTKGTASFFPEAIMTMADEVADDFLRLEKYVNLNFMGFHKVRRRVRVQFNSSSGSSATTLVILTLRPRATDLS
jgi:SPX domain protein involved in polyphosphate accumulation